MKKINARMGFSIAAYHANKQDIMPQSSPAEKARINDLLFIQTSIHADCWHMPAKLHKPISLIYPLTNTP